MWGETRTLAAVLEGLRRPSSGSAYTAWAASAELRAAARVAAALLRHAGAPAAPPGRREAAAPLLRAAIAAAQVPPISRLRTPLSVGTHAAGGQSELAPTAGSNM